VKLKINGESKEVSGWTFFWFLFHFAFYFVFVIQFLVVIVFGWQPSAHWIAMVALWGATIGSSMACVRCAKILAGKE